MTVVVANMPSRRCFGRGRHMIGDAEVDMRVLDLRVLAGEVPARISSSRPWLVLTSMMSLFSSA